MDVSGQSGHEDSPDVWSNRECFERLVHVAAPLSAVLCWFLAGAIVRGAKPT